MPYAVSDPPSDTNTAVVCQVFTVHQLRVLKIAVLEHELYRMLFSPSRFWELFQSVFAPLLQPRPGGEPFCTLYYRALWAEMVSIQKRKHVHHVDGICNFCGWRAGVVDGKFGNDKGVRAVCRDWSCSTHGRHLLSIPCLNVVSDAA